METDRSNSNNSNNSNHSTNNSNNSNNSNNNNRKLTVLADNSNNNSNNNKVIIVLITGPRPGGRRRPGPCGPPRFNGKFNNAALLLILIIL